MLNPLHKKLSQLQEVIIDLKVTPRSKTNQILDCFEQLNGHLLLKIKIQGIPEKGRVNEELINFLSQELNLAKSHFQIISGFQSRQKILRIIAPFAHQ